MNKLMMIILLAVGLLASCQPESGPAANVTYVCYSGGEVVREGTGKLHGSGLTGQRTITELVDGVATDVSLPVGMCIFTEV